MAVCLALAVLSIHMPLFAYIHHQMMDIYIPTILNPGILQWHCPFVTSDVEIGFNPITYSVNENTGSVMVTVAVVSGTLNQDVEVSVSTVAGSATGRGM